MTFMAIKRVISGAFAGVALIAGSACSASFHAGAFLDEEDVEKQLSQILQEKTGSKPDEVNCPDDLPGKKDAVLKCTVSDASGDRAVKLTVTEVDGSDIRFHYELEPADGGGSPAATIAEPTLEQKVSSLLEQQVGQRPDQIDCPGDLAGVIRETMRCTLTAGTDELGLTVTVTEVEGTTVNFDVEVDDNTASPAG